LITNIEFPWHDPRTGQVQFARYGNPPQQYYGTLSGDRIEGTFGPPGELQAFPGRRGGTNKNLGCTL